MPSWGTRNIWEENDGYAVPGAAAMVMEYVVVFETAEAVFQE